MRKQLKTFKVFRSKSKKERKEQFMILLKCSVLLCIISYLFYDSFWAALVLSPMLYVLYKGEYKKAQNKKREKIKERFKDVLQSVLTALRAGYSVENAFKEAERDLQYRFGKEDDMVAELAVINRQVKNSIPIDKLITNLAERTGSDDIKDFAAVFAIAKKSGGDMGKILERTISIISRRMELKQEIALLVASRKYEQQIMNMVPIGIIFYIRFTNKGYFDSLYHDVFGVAVMTAALGVYYLAYTLSEKILDIA